MKSLQVIGACISVLASCPAVHAESFLTNGLVAYYPFQGDASDASGNNNDGAILGYDWAFLSDRFGQSNSLWLNRSAAYATSLDGAYVLVPRDALLDFNQDFSLSAWVNLAGGTPAYAPQNLIANEGDTRGVNLRVITDEIPGNDYIQGLWNLGKPSLTDVHARWPSLRQAWWQVVLVRSGATVSLFRNGFLLTNSPAQGPVSNGPAIWLGRHPVGLTYPLLGGIDDVRFYNRALSPLEVAQLYLSEEHCIPHAARAVARVNNGFVVEIQVTDYGCGYTNAPLVQLVGGGGSNATATAHVDCGGVTGITISDTGSGYTNAPRVLIASPPFAPWLELAVSKVRVTLHVVLGKDYVLESSADLVNWTQVGEPFTAEDEVITQEFDVVEVGRFFRVRQVR